MPEPVDRGDRPVRPETALPADRPTVAGGPQGRDDVRPGEGHHARPPADDDASVALVRAAAGDPGAYEVVYRATSPHVFGLVTHLLRDPARAEEVTQDVFVEGWRLAGRFDPHRGTARAWMLTLAHRRAVDRIRSEQRSRDRELRDARRVAVAPAGPDEIVADQLDGERVRAALGSLSDVQREAVELAYYGGLAHREVAEHLDLPLGTVKSRIRDGLIRLRSELGDAP